MKILVLGGGDSPERAVSLRSSKAVANAARTAGYSVTETDPASDPAFFNNIDRETIVFPILHGAGGEDGILQQILERNGIPFLGSGSTSSERCFDKWQTRKDLLASGLTVAEGGLVTKETYSSHHLAHSPHVLKVTHGGSSIGTLIIRDPTVPRTLELEEIFGMHDGVLIEQLIEGTEITVPILDQTALPVIEIIPPPSGEFDYNNKYNGQSQELCPPKTVSKEKQYEAQKLAEEVHKTMNCRHLSRVDTIVDKTGKLYVLEINTIPGLTEQSLYPKSADFAGLDMPALITKFVELVKRDYNL